MTTEEIRHGTIDDDHLIELSTYVTYGWPLTRADIVNEVQPYWFFRDEVVFTDGIMMKGGKIIIPGSLQKRQSGHLHGKHMGKEKKHY